MLLGWVIVTVSFVYLGMLFAIAYYGDKRGDAGRSIIAKPTIYALSLAVYCTTWTFYGSVGRAASTGIGFLPIYLGPTLMAGLWWFVMLKIIRISKANRITSIADFVASRYGKSQMLGGLVTVIAVVGVMPYISLQLKAVSNSFTILLHYPDIVMPARAQVQPFFQDSALYIAMILAAFTIVFGTRHLDASERHEGMVAAVAFESVVKLLAFLAVGVFVTFGIYKGFGDIFHRAAAVPKLKALMTMADSGASYANWWSLTFLSMLSIMLLPRQFQIAVVENVSEQHVARATWLFPLYLLLINIFVLPITLGGLLHFPDGTVDADTFVLTLPMAEHREALALFVFIGGLSAAAAMVIVETIALSTMVCNDLVMPVLLRQQWLRLHERQDLSGVLLAIRRWAIAGILLLGYVYFRSAGEAYALVSIGLISFAAVAQFAPSIFGAIYWKEGTKNGAITGLLAGFAVWGYTLLLPSFAKSGWLSPHFIEEGLFGTALLKPHELFGVSGLDEISHSLFWSMLANIAAYVGVSLAGRPSPVEADQATLFVDVFRRTAPDESSHMWRGGVQVGDLLSLLGRFVGPERARDAFLDFAQRRGLASIDELQATGELVHYAETLLAGAIGSASARVMVASVTKEEKLGIDDVMSILDEASQARAYSRQLEQKSRELEEITAEALRERAKLLELTHDTVFVRDMNNIITFWNRGAETLYGWTRDEAIGQVAHQLMQTVFPAPLEEMMSELNSTGRWEGELTYTRRGGTQVVVASRWALQLDERGKPIAVLETSNDITERKRGEEEMRKLASLVENGTDFIGMASLEGEVLFVNAAGQTLVGLAGNEQVRETKIPDYYAEQDLERFMNVVLPVVFKDGRWEGETLFRHFKTGASISMWQHVFFITDEVSGRRLALATICRDITERKRAEQHLRAQYTVTQMLAEATTLEEVTPKILQTVCEFLLWDLGVLWRIDRETGVLRCMEVWHKESVEVAQFEAISRESTFMPGVGLPGRAWSSHEPAYIPDIAQDANFTRASIAGREGLHAAFAFPILLGGEVSGVVEFFSREIRQPEQELLNMMATLGSQMGQFIERKRAENALHNAQMELAHVARVSTLGEMTASIAHEINQPLGAIANSASACLRWLEAQKLKEARRSASRVIAESHRASEIIDRIRALTKKAPPRKDWLDVNETIHEVIALAQNEVQRNGVALGTQLSDDVPLILADRIQLQQVILNLMMNAIEAMSGAGEGPRELWVRSGADGSQSVLVSVQDSGPGLDPNSLDHIFDAFYTTKPQGLGMGLAISRSLIEAHGGQLWATANVPHGAVFQFTLPTSGEKVA